jgi:lipopolysaccharide transport system ATP-binding protein
MSDIAIKVENLSKKYTIGKKTYGTLRNTLANLLTTTNPKQDFWALKDVNFTINRGDAVGIIGRNGAGKSTLLKILSKITAPTTGRIEMDEFATSLLEVGTGFHPELTGRENIFLNGSILGMNRAEIKLRLDEIIDFSGVEKFIDTPVKHYSSGMYVRLAFSVSAHIRSNILLVDEVLAVGDIEFQQKCLGKMEEVSGQGRTVLFVSHNLDTIKMLCKNSMLIEGGKIVYNGDTAAAINLYETGLEAGPNNTVRGSQRVTISSMSFNNSVILSSESCEITFELENKSAENFSEILLDVGIDNFGGKRVGWLTSGPRIQIKAFGKTTFKIVINNWCFKPGKYYFTTFLKVKNEVLEWVDNRALIQATMNKDSELIVPPRNQGDVLLDYNIKF